MPSKNNADFEADSGTGRWSNLPWQKLDVNKNINNNKSTTEDSRGGKRKRQTSKNEDNDDEENGYNHYDNPKADPSELYTPAVSAKNFQNKDSDEGAGILFGIEVIDGSYFDVKKDVAEDTAPNDNSAAKDDSKDGSDAAAQVSSAKETKKKKKKKQKDAKSSKEIETKKIIEKKDIDTHKAKNDKDKDVSEKTIEEGAEKKLTKNQRRNLKRKARKAAKKQEKRQKMEEEAQQKKVDTLPQSDQTNDDDENDNNGENETKQAQDENKRPKQQEKKKKQKQPNQKQEPNDMMTPPTDDEVSKIQTDWSVAAGGIWLHPNLCSGLASKGFASPTPIQASTLPASILGKRDIVGAAPTGSGKTLAYALPILHDLLTTRDENKEDSEENQSKEKRQCLEALVLCPTRELALQVSREVLDVCKGEIQCGTLLGGLSEQKQKRVLEKRPPVLVATPGRLWDMMSSNEHPHLQDLTQLRFLVIDEADRMISQGSFPQMKRIFEAINRANPPPLSEAEMEEAVNEDDDDDDDDDPDRLRSLQGVRGEAKVVMLNDDILKMIEQQRKEGGPGGTAQKGGNEDEEEEDDGDSSSSSSTSVPPEPIEMGDDEYLEQQRQLEEEMEDSGASSDDDEEEESVHRQTFIYSATLTLPHISLHKKSKPSNEGKKGKKKQKGPTIEGAIEEILEKAGARGQTKVVDLSSEKDAKITSVSDQTSKKNQEDSSGQKKKQQQDGGNKAVEHSASPTCARLPPGLSIKQVMCAQMHKDSHLYAYLITTAQGSSGPCLVFCNSIGAVRRVAETLRVLGLPAKGLHAQMSQKARFSSLESLRKTDSRSIVVATDVAARGLDIPSVATVVHYDVPRAMDTFIHRAGRTARGVGDKAVGTSISLVAPSEERAHTKICEGLLGSGTKGLDEAPIDGRLLSQAQERTALATKIVSCEEVESKASRSNKWFIEAASDAGLDVDEDLLDGGLIDGDRRDRQRLGEAKQAKAKLRELLSKPMRRQNYGKFLSGVGITESIRVESEVNPYVVSDSGPKRKKKSKKKQK